MKNGIIVLMFLSLLFGIVGGVGGELFSRFYLFQDIYKVPLFGEINVPDNIYGGSNLIIDSPKKVIVEQNTKVSETINSASKNIVGIFRKIENDTIISTSTFKIADNYYTRNYNGQGFIITSDGWIMSKFIPSELLAENKKISTTSLLLLKERLAKNYIIINSEGKIFDLSDFSYEQSGNITFWKIDADDLGVKQFKKISNIGNGELVVAVNFNGTSIVTTIAQKYPLTKNQLFSSEKIYSEISLTIRPDKSFGDGFLLSTEGDLIAIFNESDVIRPVSSYLYCLACIFDKKTLSRPYLGINYINLSFFSNPITKERYSHGALLYSGKDAPAVIEGSPAATAGLKEGDIIIAVNTTKLNSDNYLSDILSELSPGEKISLAINRASEELNIVVTLESLQEID